MGWSGCTNVRPRNAGPRKTGRNKVQQWRGEVDQVWAGLGRVKQGGAERNGVETCSSSSSSRGDFLPT